MFSKFSTALLIAALAVAPSFAAPVAASADLVTRDFSEDIEVRATEDFVDLEARRGGGGRGYSPRSFDESVDLEARRGGGGRGGGGFSRLRSFDEDTDLEARDWRRYGRPQGRPRRRPQSMESRSFDAETVEIEARARNAVPRSLRPVNREWRRPSYRRIGEESRSFDDTDILEARSRTKKNRPSSNKPKPRSSNGSNTGKWVDRADTALRLGQFAQENLNQRDVEPLDLEARDWKSKIGGRRRGGPGGRKWGGRKWGGPRGPRGPGRRRRGNVQPKVQAPETPAAPTEEPTQT